MELFPNVPTARTGPTAVVALHSNRAAFDRWRNPAVGNGRMKARSRHLIPLKWRLLLTRSHSTKLRYRCTYCYTTLRYLSSDNTRHFGAFWCRHGWCPVRLVGSASFPQFASDFGTEQSSALTTRAIYFLYESKSKRSSCHGCMWDCDFLGTGAKPKPTPNSRLDGC